MHAWKWGKQGGGEGKLPENDESGNLFAQTQPNETRSLPQRSRVSPWLPCPCLFSRPLSRQMYLVPDALRTPGNKRMV